MSTIQVWADTNERPPDNPALKKKHRMTAFGEVLFDDARFEWMDYKSLDVDLQFMYEHTWDWSHLDDPTGAECSCEFRYFNVELKECSDYLASAFGAPGHLYQQILSMRESGSPGMVLVLGGDAEISEAIAESTKTRYRGAERAYQISSMEDRLIDFEANAAALGVPVVRWQARPWRKLLSTVHKALTGGDLTGYRPRPANGERDLVAASLLFPGMGPTLLAPIMEDYSLMLVPRREDSRPISTFPKIGKKRQSMLDARTAMIYGMVKA